MGLELIWELVVNAVRISVRAVKEPLKLDALVGAGPVPAELDKVFYTWTCHSWALLLSPVSL